MSSLSTVSMSTVADEVVIYGAGNTGKSICCNLELLGIKVLAFIDKNKRGIPTFCDHPLYELGKVDDRLLKKQVLIAIHNREVDIEELVVLLRRSGFQNIVTMIDYINFNPSDETFRYFLSPADAILSKESQINEFKELLCDQKSKDLYEGLLMFRLGHGYQYCPKPEHANQYAPSDISRWANPMSLIDCGAYTGDSIRTFKKNNYDISSLVAFEPDPVSYQKLITSCQSLNALLLPCGVGRTADVLRFNSGGSEGSRVSNSGDVVIQICSIDEILWGWAPTLIKMDIEGAEYDAIQGAKNIIRKHRPGLAISIYHTPQDLWRLGLAINEIAEGYQFYIRCHGYSSFDTVLYGLPS